MVVSGWVPACGVDSQRRSGECIELDQAILVLASHQEHLLLSWRLVLGGQGVEFDAPWLPRNASELSDERPVAGVILEDAVCGLRRDIEGPWLCRVIVGVECDALRVFETSASLLDEDILGGTGDCEQRDGQLERTQGRVRSGLDP